MPSPAAPHVLPTPETKAPHVRAMFDAIAPRYELVNHLITFGLDRRWRRRAIAALGLGAGATVVDVGCGTGDFLRLAAAAGLRPLGVDPSRAMIARAHPAAPVVLAEGEHIPAASGSFDGALSGFALRNVSDLAAVLAELSRVLRAGGRLALLEVDAPQNPVLRWGHALWFRHGVPAIGGLLSDRAAYRYLPASASYLPDAATLAGMLAEAGFAKLRRIPLGGGAAQLVTAERTAP